MEIFSSKTLKNDIKEIVEEFRNQEFYFDINIISQEEKRLVSDLTSKNNSREYDKGFKIRVWDGEKFLEKGDSNITKESIRSSLVRLLNSAKHNQNTLSTKRELKIEEENIEKEFNQKTDSEQFSLKDKLEKIEKIRDKIKQSDEDIVNVRVGIIEKYDEHYFTNKYKQLYQKIPIITLIKVPFVKCLDGEVRNNYQVLTDNNLKSLFERSEKGLNELLEIVNKLKKAKKLKGGKYKAVLSPKLTGLLAHESFGHGLEADTMMKDRALANEWLGKKIAPDFVSVIDYSNIEGKHGQLFFDFDGNVAKKTYLVKNGYIDEPMSDIYSKTRLNLNNSSNSRIESYDHKNYTRMTNTYFEPGEDSYKDFISEINDGIFLHNSSGGMEDPKGWGVQLQGCFGQRIKNGELIDEYYDGFSLTGFLPDILNNIKKISKEFELEGTGYCGKGHKEWVRVSEGGPYLLVNEVILG